MSEFPIITKLGGPERVCERLAQRGMLVRSGETAILRWHQRGGISRDAMLALWDEAKLEGLSVGPDDFRIPDRAA
jgi:hypothetical protein